ncbi:MFS transporter [Pyxidicoccus parkwayensis]|uniref:MFS transporter n=1 Tax=Pyxidicoccus parkwayensis TaxID=2813578 RepID=A0ABX7NK36_9BACT|nr:MFS transporter [Pyxidicoccus parkwaysis]QSQ18816.1 MFS transporter [Pyxidicoccus parkwaysis]
MRTFGTVWLGQFISTLGSSLTTFALGAYVYQTSGSVTGFALVSFFGLLPTVLLSPLAGVLADRWDRRKLMLLGDMGAALGIFLIWALFAGEKAGLWTIKIWYFYGPLLIGSSFSTMCFPAWTATVPLLVPRKHLGRASGMAELSAAISQIAGPIIATALLGFIGLQGILLVDAISYFFAIAALFIVRFPTPPRDAARAGRRSLRADIVEGWHFIRERRGLIGLMAFVTITGFIVSMVMLLINPLVLAFTDIDHLKWIATSAGVGMLTGGVVTSIWGGPQRRILGIAALSTMSGFILLLAALPPSVPLIAVSAAVFVFTFPLTSACNQFIWQTKVPPELQGRVAALRRVVFQAMALSVSLVGGVLADKVFEPLMAHDGALAGSVGRVIGTGQGRGVALMFLILSVLVLVNVAVMLMSPRTRNVESELPDALPAHPRIPTVPTPAPADVAAAPRLATGSSES